MNIATSFNFTSTITLLIILGVIFISQLPTPAYAGVEVSGVKIEDSGDEGQSSEELKE
ncbi:MAG: hypothetical protein R3A13_00035 [Bdellovibrionota bacterium]